MEKKRIEFEIGHLDSLGQGVAKKDGEVYFIKKTLPGERGIASFLAKSKGVHFYKLEELLTTSPLRQKPECSHFSECGGCDYLHTSYDEELKNKKDQLARLFQKIVRKNNDIFVHRAPKRLAYRNRIQLHYNKKEKRLGFLNLERKIFNLNHCPVANDQVNLELQKIRNNEHWLELTKNQPATGHLEIYHQKISLNKPYADGGFTQVYEEMNSVLKNIISEEINSLSLKNSVIDLFGGNGNFSMELPFLKKWVIDFYKKTPESKEQITFTHQDLYADDAVSALLKLKNKLRLPETDLLIIDPPRSGLKNLNEFLELFFPKLVIYISCQSSSLARDVKELHSSYEITNLHLVDLFPGTHHYETVLILARKDC